MAILLMSCSRAEDSYADGYIIEISDSGGRGGSCISSFEIPIQFLSLPIEINFRGRVRES